MSTANDAISPQDDLPHLPEPVILPGESRNRCWERIRKEGRASGLNKHQAYDRANREIARLFATDANDQTADQPADNSQQTADQADEKEAGGVANQPADAGMTMERDAEDTRANEPAVRGLADIPSDWPQLAPNASLAAEIQWVQANRLRCVRETADIVSVDLTRALTPAPSYGAISWLETSIKAYTKFCDVAAKATANQDDEKAHVRRERLAIEEIRSLLAEMLPQN